jgi:FixJ family two-component response regulator
MTAFKPTVFVVDDDASVRRGLSYLLRSAGYKVETFGSAEVFLQRGQLGDIGCIVLDVRMPGMSGLDLQEELGRQTYPMPIIYITGHGDIPMGIKAMKKGAVDFLPKPFDDKQLLQAVENALGKARREKETLDEIQRIRMRLDKLTPREYETFRYVITGLLNKQIALKLNIAEQTVKVHRGRIMEKLKVTSVADLVRLAEKAGIKPPEDKCHQSSINRHQ